MNRFKNSSGAHLIKSIFYELDEQGRPNALYTLKDYDSEFEGVKYKSLRRLYVELEDPTEYIFSETYLDGWSHWKKICQSSFFKPHLKEWREELDVRLRAKALVRVKKRAEDNSKDGLQADKLLLSGGWKTPEDKDKVGRPSKDKIKAEAEKLFQEQQVFDEDYERVMKSTVQ